MKIYALIPARGGSKRIPRKNLKIYAGHQLIYWSIKIGLDCQLIDQVFVSTDDEEIAEVSRNYGAQVPFLRPASISGDLATDLECAQHFLKWFDQKSCKYKKPDLIVHLRPTYPNRKLDILNSCLHKFLENKIYYDSLRTVTRTDKPPYKMYNISSDESGEMSLIPLFLNVSNRRDTSKVISEPYNSPTQILPETFWHNGYIDIVKSSVIEQGSMSGSKIIPYLMDDSEIDDIDTIEEWEASETKFLTSTSI